MSEWTAGWMGGALARGMTQAHTLSNTVYKVFISVDGTFPSRLKPTDGVHLG